MRAKKVTERRPIGSPSVTCASVPVKDASAQVVDGPRPQPGHVHRCHAALFADLGPAHVRGSDIHPRPQGTIAIKVDTPAALVSALAIVEPVGPRLARLASSFVATFSLPKVSAERYARTSLSATHGKQGSGRVDRS